MQPKDAQTKIDGIWHKVGVRGIVFAWVNGGWVRSSKSREEVERAELNIRYSQGQFWRWMKVGDVERIRAKDRHKLRPNIHFYAEQEGKEFSVKSCHDDARICTVERISQQFMA